MSQMIVRAEHLPSRCEVCHQADAFDKQANFCARCASLRLPAVPVNLTMRPAPKNKLSPMEKYVAGLVGGSISGAITFLVIFLFPVAGPLGGFLAVKYAAHKLGAEFISFSESMGIGLGAGVIASLTMVSLTLVAMLFVPMESYAVMIFLTATPITVLFSLVGAWLAYRGERGMAVEAGTDEAG